MQVWRDKVFLDERLVLNGVDAQGCTFDGCVLVVWRGGEGCRIEHNTMNACRLEGDGWPPEVLAECGAT